MDERLVAEPVNAVVVALAAGSGLTGPAVAEALAAGEPSIAWTVAEPAQVVFCLDVTRE